jgi:hypothetical protein
MCSMEVLRYPIPRSATIAPFFFSRQIQAYKVPAIVVEGCNFGLKVYTTLTLDNVMIAETLIPRNVVKDALAVHIDPGFLEAENSACSEVDATIVEIVANGDPLELSGAAFHRNWIMGENSQRHCSSLSRRPGRHILTCPLHPWSAHLCGCKGSIHENLLCNAVALPMYCLSPGSQSLVTSFGISMPAATS